MTITGRRRKSSKVLAEEAPGKEYPRRPVRKFGLDLLS